MVPGSFYRRRLYRRRFHFQSRIRPQRDARNRDRCQENGVPCCELLRAAQINCF